MVSVFDLYLGDIVNFSGQYGDENFLFVGMDFCVGVNVNIGVGDVEDVGGVCLDIVMLVNILVSCEWVVVVLFFCDLVIILI